MLLVAVHDLNTHVGCYGNPIVKTPNIDGLASRGILFEHATCQAPICGPSRASMMTGHRPESTGVYDNYVGFRDRLPDVVTLPRFFKDNGYTTMQIGKVFHGQWDDPDAWCNWRPEMPLTFPEKSKREQALAESMTPAERMMRWGPTDNEDAAETDGSAARRAVQAIEELEDRPFFIGLGFHKPHTPLIAPQQYFDLYDPDEIEVRTGPRVEGNYHRYLRAYAKRDLTERDAREVVAAYYACTSFMDAQLGLVLEALERKGLTDTTIVVFWSDHGWLLGEHWCWAKHCLWEEACRVPLVVTGPGVAHPGRPCSGLVESVDLYPTLAELCGLGVPDALQGLSMVPLMQDPDRDWKRCAITQHRVPLGPRQGYRTVEGDLLGTSIRTDRYRYTEWGAKEKVELYDHDHDPYEYRNVAGNPAYADTVAELHELLGAGWRGAMPES